MGKGKSQRERAALKPAAPWFEPHWSALGFRLAALSGAAAGLVGLWSQVSPGTAALRAGAVLFSVLGLFRLGARLLGSRWAAPQADPDSVAGPASSTEAPPAR